MNCTELVTLGPLASPIAQVPESPPQVRKEEGTVLYSRRREGTLYLLQQEDLLRVFGQVVCSEAALDACSDHNSIPETFLSSHDIRLALQPQSPWGQSKQRHLPGQRRRRKAKFSLAKVPTIPGCLCPCLSFPPKSLAQGSASASPAEQSWVD